MQQTLTIGEKRRVGNRFSNLDLEKLRYTKNAESKCGSVRDTQYTWSPKLEQAREKVSYWKRRLTIDREIRHEDTTWRKHK